MLTMKGQIECKRVVNWSAILRQVGTRLIRQGVLSGRLLMKDGWSWNTSHRLVTETDWQQRMYRAWSVLSTENRGIATALDYEVYQNYWPNLEFCADGFEGKMERWIAWA